MRLVSLALMMLAGADGGASSALARDRITLNAGDFVFTNVDLDDYFETDIACANGAVPKASLKGRTLHIVCARDGGR